MPTNIHLQKTPKSYNRFQPNQVLTDTQLNAMIDHFERQHRLSRSCLVGVGVVCGLDFVLQENTSLTITPGLGLTTDGDLLHHAEATTFELVSPFDDKAAQYDPFWDGDVQRVALWELVDGDQDEDREVFSLSDFAAQTGAELEDMVLLAYLDAFAKEGNICTPLDCNNQGVEQVAKLRFLLASKGEVRRIVREQDDIYQRFGERGQNYFNLPKVRAPRLILDADASVSGGKLLERYGDLIAEHRDSFLDALRLLVKNFGPLLDAENQIDVDLWEEHFDEVFPRIVTERNPAIDQQYRYEHYIDLTAAYTEMRTALHEVLVICLPNNGAFPRHLMLGALAASAPGFDLDFRHAFYPSPAEVGAFQQLQGVRSLYRRLHAMMVAYQDPSRIRDVKITPSAEANAALGDQTIPFYYRPTEELLMHWDFNKLRRGQAKENLSYHAGSYAAAYDTATLAPLRHNHQDLPFYRIEGHIGKTYGDVIDDLESARAEYGLDFDIVALRIGAERTDVDLDEYDVFFQDLQVLMTAWRAEQICLLGNASKFFSGFSLEQPGVHKKYKPVAFQIGERDPINPVNFGGNNFGIGNVNPVVLNPGFGFSLPPTVDIRPTVANFELQRTFSVERKGGSVFVDDKTIQPTNKQVEQALEVEGKVIGLQAIETIQANKGREGATLRDDLLDRIDAFWLDQNIVIGDFDRDEVNVAVEMPVNLIARLQYLTEQQPEDLTDFTAERIAAYRKALQELATAVRTAKDKLQRVFEKADRQKMGYERDYLQMLNQLEMNVCSAKKMELLLEEFEDRKAQLLKLTNFTEYINQHPALEHRGGVARGGTFVLVYKDQDSPKKGGSNEGATINPGIVRPRYDLLKNLNATIQFDKAILQGKTAEKFIERSKQIVTKKGFSQDRSQELIKREELRKTPLEFADYLVTNHRQFNIEKTIRDYQLATGVSSRYRDIIKGAVVEGIINKGKVVREPNVQQFTVLADFCLPYRCCSKLPPLTIALPRRKVSVQLPVAFLCVSANPDADKPNRFPITVVPSDGLLENDSGVAGLVVKEEETYFFEPQAVTEELFGKTISFTVDGEGTDAELRIYREPEAAYSFEIEEAKDDSKVISWNVKFSNETAIRDDENLSYLWDFGDGSSSQEVSPQHTFSILLDQFPDSNPVFKVNLRVANGPCVNARTEELELPLPDLGGDREYQERGMELIRADEERVRFLLEKSADFGGRGVLETIEMVGGIYESLEKESAVNTLFAGRINATWNDQHGKILERLGEFLNDRDEPASQIREAILLLFKMYLIPLGGQEKLNSSDFDRQVMTLYRKAGRRIVDREEGWFEREGEPGFAFLQFFAEYREVVKFTDFQLVNELKRIESNLNRG